MLKKFAAKFALWLCASQILALSATAAVNGTDLFTGQSIEVKAGELGLVVAFLSAKCPCSISHVPELLNLAKTHPRFAFVAINSNADESLELARTYFREAKVPFPVIRDADAKLADQYRALKTPHVFVTDAKGATVFQGGMSDSSNCDESGKKYLREALADVSAGRKVRTASARPLGCTITRK